jgi:molybdate transport system ATP-binding protein
MDSLICACRKRLPSGFTLDAELTLPLDEARVTVLFGPSGSGKTTLLRLLTGLDRPDSGNIRFRGETWCDTTQAIHVTPQRRRAGFLFQDYALFPHLTVAGNVGYAAAPDTARRMIDTFGLADLSARLPRELSGGQQQRVALARALAAGPALLLLDEPLSALDAATRARTRHQLRSELVAAGVPSIVVTHDRMEAVALGDWMAVMIDGRIHQTGLVREVFRHPADHAVAESVGIENILPAEIAGRHDGLLTLRLGPCLIECVDLGETAPLAACIRAEEITLTHEPAPSSARNRLPGTVRAVIVEGALARVELDCGVPLVALLTAQSTAEMRLTAGDTVTAVVKATAIHLVSAPAENSGSGR